MNKDSQITNQQSTIKNQPCRLSPAMLLNLAQAYAAKGDLAAAERQVAAAYAESPDVKDGYARCGWQYFAVKKDYSQVGRQLLATRADYSNIIRRTTRDLDSRRLSPQGEVIHAKALAHIDGIDAISPLVEKLYDENPDFKNAWSQIAWDFFIPARRAFREVIPFLERDFQLGRFGGDWQLNYAQALAVVGREAEAESRVVEAYASDIVLLDGFSRCAWAGFWPKKQHRKVIEWMERDSRAVGQSVSLSVNQTCATRPDLGSGLAHPPPPRRAGVAESVNQRQSFVNHPVKRISASQRLNLAQAYAAVGDLAKAEEQVAAAYTEALDAKDGYSRIAWQYFWPKKEYTKVLELMERDAEEAVGQSVNPSVNQSSGQSVNQSVRQNQCPASQITNHKSTIKNQPCRLSPATLINLAVAHAAKGDLATAESLVESAYAEDPCVKDGYARVGWARYWLLKEYDKVIEWMEMDVGQPVRQSDSQAAGQPDRYTGQPPDRPTGRLSPAMLLNRAKAVAKVEGIEAGFCQVEEICIENPDFKNPRSQLAWMLFLEKRITHEEVIPYFEKDRQEGRLMGEYLLTYAESLAVVGREADAEELVLEAYREAPELKDARARIAWKLFWPKKEYDKVIEWMERDLRYSIQNMDDSLCASAPLRDTINNQKSKIENQQSSLSPAMLLSLAQAYAAKGHMAGAEQCVATAYAENPKLKDGYARIGWIAFASKPDERIKALPYLEKDYAAERLSPAHMLNLAQLYAQKGDLDAVGKFVEKAYASDTKLKNGYARIGLQAFAENKDYASIRIWVKRDADADRLTPNWLLNQAKAIARTDGMESAIPFVEDAYEADPGLKNGFAQVAWSRFIPEDMAYEKVLRYFEKDIERGALNGEWQLNYAQALAVMDREDEAEKNVAAAYARDPNLKNGYARCGFARHFQFHYQPEKALSWFGRDIESGRLLSMFRTHYASVLAATGALGNAQAIVEQAYADDPMVNSGHSLVGWYYYVIQMGDPKKALPLFERDIEVDRLRSNAGILYAGLYAHLGNKEKAEDIVKEHYKADPKIGEGYMFIGLCS